MRYVDRRVSVHLWVVHVVIFGYVFSIVNDLLDDPGTTLLAGVLAAIPVGAILLPQIWHRRTKRPAQPERLSGAEHPSSQCCQSTVP